MSSIVGSVRSQSELFEEEPERTYPDSPPNAVATHLERYRFALQWAGEKVLDVGCGSGYGARELASANGVGTMLGVDVSRDAVRFAQQEYGSPTCSYLTADAVRLPFSAHSFDLVTCFEVIEHVESPHGLLQEIARVVKTDAQVLISSPNKALTSPLRRTPTNPFHRHEWYEDELVSLISQRLTIHRIFGQGWTPPLRGTFHAFMNSWRVYPWLRRTILRPASIAEPSLAGENLRERIEIQPVPRTRRTTRKRMIPSVLIFLCSVRALN